MTNVVVVWVGGEEFNCARDTLVASSPQWAKELQNPAATTLWYPNGNPKLFRKVLNFVRDPTAKQPDSSLTKELARYGVEPNGVGEDVQLPKFRPYQLCLLEDSYDCQRKEPKWLPYGICSLRAAFTPAPIFRATEDTKFAMGGETFAADQPGFPTPDGWIDSADHADFGHQPHFTEIEPVPFTNGVRPKRTGLRFFGEGERWFSSIWLRMRISRDGKNLTFAEAIRDGAIGRCIGRVRRIVGGAYTDYLSGTAIERLCAVAGWGGHRNFAGSAFFHSTDNDGRITVPLPFETIAVRDGASGLKVVPQNGPSLTYLHSGAVEVELKLDKRNFAIDNLALVLEHHGKASLGWMTENVDMSIPWDRIVLRWENCRKEKCERDTANSRVYYVDSCCSDVRLYTTTFTLLAGSGKPSRAVRLCRMSYLYRKMRQWGSLKPDAKSFVLWDMTEREVLERMKENCVVGSAVPHYQWTNEATPMHRWADSNVLRVELYHPLPPGEELWASVNYRVLNTRREVSGFSGDAFSN
jgi:hypothetical protein